MNTAETEASKEVFFQVPQCEQHQGSAALHSNSPYRKPIHGSHLQDK